MSLRRRARIGFLAGGVGVAIAAAIAIPVLANGFVYAPDGDPHDRSTAASPRAAAKPSTVARPTAPGSPFAETRPTAPASPESLGAPRGSVVTADPAWVHDRAARTGVPEPAMRAYAAAVLRQQQATPGCGIGWTTLAGIGSVETHHGTIDGRTVTEDGKALPRIVGIPLSGGDVATIPDTDLGLVDGDARWDRAVGPMQFIPQSWADWGVDADADGTADPDDIDDAASTAARYLCADGHNLKDQQGWITAIASYNHQEDYVRAVAEEANRLGSL